MDTPIARGEFEEYKRTTEQHFERISEENKRQNKRLDKVEQSAQELVELTASIRELTMSVKNMQKTQDKYGEQLEELKSRDGEKWRSLVGYLIAALVGAAISCIPYLVHAVM